MGFYVLDFYFASLYNYRIPTMVVGMSVLWKGSIYMGGKKAVAEEPKARKVTFKKCDAEGCPVEEPHGHFYSTVMGQSPTVASLVVGDMIVDKLTRDNKIDDAEAALLKADIRAAGLNQETTLGESIRLLVSTL